MLGLLLPRLMPFGGFESGGGEDPMEGPVSDRDPFLLVELLEEMLEVEPGILTPVQIQDPPLGFRVGLPFRGLALVPVAEGGCPLLGIGLLKHVHVLLAYPELRGGLPRRELPQNSLLYHRFDVRVVESVHGSILRPNDGTEGN